MADSASEVISLQSQQKAAATGMSSDWWINPILNKDCGKVEPSPKAAGLVAYANGTDWNPNSEGEGYYLCTGSSWVKLVLKTDTFTISAKATDSLTADDADKLGGELPAVYQTAQAIATAFETASAGTNGGTSSSTTWHKRTLVESTDVKNLLSISSGVMVLTAGTYMVRAWSTVYRAGLNKIRLRNTTAGTTLIDGASTWAETNATYSGGSIACLMGIITVAAAQNLELQHYVTVGVATTGLGYAVNASGASEVYAGIEFIKIA